jgi:hypothetical protein
MRNLYEILVGKPKGGNHLGDIRADGKLIIKFILQEESVMMWTGLNWLRLGPVALL